MNSLSDLRRRLRFAMAVLIGLNVLAIGALVYMMVRGTSALPAQFQSLHEQVREKKAVAVAPEGVEKRITEAREQIAHFYEDRFPNSSSAIFETLGRVAKDNHVRLNQASYKVNEQVDFPGVRQIDVTADLSGNYAEAMKFINSLEREKMFFIVDNVALRDQQTAGGGNVQLTIHIETFMRGEA